MILDEIAQRTRERVAAQKQQLSLEEIKAQAYALAETQEKQFVFEEALKGKGIHFICEVKKASPSRGVIAEDFPYLAIAADYEQAGASAISVLTEPYYFQGSNQYLQEIRHKVKIPLLRKDFTVDAYMIYEAKILGADAVLLICSLLDEEELSGYIKIADSLGLSSLVEAHSKEEIAMAIRCNARIIGVNNRDLKTFTVDLQNSVRLRSLVPEDIVFVSESGMKTAGDIAELVKNGVNAVLIGETLMKSADKKAVLEEMKSAKSKAPGCRVKICGLRREQDIAYANQCKPDYVGFVFADSRRKVSPEQAAALRAGLSEDILAVGVFVNEEPGQIIALLQKGIIDLAQLHGSESEEQIRRIREATGKPVIKAVKVRSAEDIEKWQDSQADYLLLDNGEGTGQSFDWKILKKLDSSFRLKPSFLAGGIRPENVVKAVLAVHPFVPFAIDVSSGVEIEGFKDLDKMKKLIKAGKEI